MFYRLLSWMLLGLSVVLFAAAGYLYYLDSDTHGAIIDETDREFPHMAVGPNTVHLTLSSASGVETKPDSMLVRLTLPSSDFGPVSSPPSLAKANHATFSDLILPKAGVWQLEVLVTFGKEQIRFSTPVKVR